MTEEQYNVLVRVAHQVAKKLNYRDDPLDILHEAIADLLRKGEKEENITAPGFIYVVMKYRICKHYQKILGKNGERESAYSLDTIVPGTETLTGVERVEDKIDVEEEGTNNIYIKELIQRKEVYIQYLKEQGYSYTEAAETVGVDLEYAKMVYFRIKWTNGVARYRCVNCQKRLNSIPDGYICPTCREQVVSKTDPVISSIPNVSHIYGVKNPKYRSNTQAKAQGFRTGEKEIKIENIAAQRPSLSTRISTMKTRIAQTKNPKLRQRLIAQLEQETAHATAS